MKARFALVACLALTQVPALAAVDAFIWFKGANELDGPNSDKSFSINSYSFPGATESQIHTGVSKLQHQPIVITKTLDKASPLLLQACASGKHFNVTLTICKLVNGKQTVESTVNLTDAVISKESKITVGGHQVEELQFTFAKIEWTWNDGGKTYNDSWDKLTLARRECLNPVEFMHAD